MSVCVCVCGQHGWICLVVQYPTPNGMRMVMNRVFGFKLEIIPETAAFIRWLCE